MSAIVASILSVGLFAGMQLYRQQLASSGPLTIFGGALGAALFLFILTAVGNLELVMFGKGFHTSVFPEVFFCLILAMIAAGRIHGVCITTCFLFSIVTTYYIQRIAQKTYGAPQSSVTATAATSHKKKNK